MSERDTLPLMRWEPPVQVLLFPLTSRIGKVRHTAGLLADKHGEDAILYHKQVTASIRRHLDHVGVPAAADDQIRAFWQAVECEMVRQTYSGSKTGGAA